MTLETSWAPWTCTYVMFLWWSLMLMIVQNCGSFVGKCSPRLCSMSACRPGIVICGGGDCPLLVYLGWVWRIVRIFLLWWARNWELWRSSYSYHCHGIPRREMPWTPANKSRVTGGTGPYHQHQRPCAEKDGRKWWNKCPNMDHILSWRPCAFANNEPKLICKIIAKFGKLFCTTMY